jgi:hypothetical protein
MPVGSLMPSSASDGGDLAAWISAAVESLFLPLLLRWSEGRTKKKIDTPFNKGGGVPSAATRRW